eukprot:TRINITY_DN2214_c0_g1_i1.p1 TRINITY_DN2214_c0_g1~~TRINITY_DN2214_c0_g1_i1.p1  ORF type:complete len:561 (-),score=202.92 TRINITY_DN2214_c0_g1_i1:190-1872(-)
MRVKKQLSKRQTLKQKYMIQKKSKEHRKKQKKMAKKSGVTLNKSKKEPRIPNSYPFKEELLKAAENEMQREQQEKLRRKELIKQKREQTERKKKAAQANAASQQRDSPLFLRQQNFQQLQQIIASSDVIIQVLDARDPAAARSAEFEALLASAGKVLIYVLNKIDLVPGQIVSDHMQTLQPYLAFACSALKHESMSPGTAALLNTLRILGRDRENPLNIAVTGFPNTGKSSLINSLKRAVLMNTSPTPGTTTTAREAKLEKSLRVVDCPGVIFNDVSNLLPKMKERVNRREQKEESEEEKKEKQQRVVTWQELMVVLRGCVTLPRIKDLMGAVSMILNKCGLDQLRASYSIAAFPDVPTFLRLVAEKKSLYKKGSKELNLMAAAQAFLEDLVGGRLSFFVVPSPSTVDRPAPTPTPALDAQALQAIQEANTQAISSLVSVHTRPFIPMEPSGDCVLSMTADPVAQAHDEDLDDAEDDEEEDDDEEVDEDDDEEEEVDDDEEDDDEDEDEDEEDMEEEEEEEVVPQKKGGKQGGRPSPKASKPAPQSKPSPKPQPQKSRKR